MLITACSFAGHAVTGDARDRDPDAVVVPDAAPVICAAPYVLTPEGCHAFPAATAIGTLAWADARSACQAIEGDLPVIDTAEESLYLAAVATGSQRVWIGLTGASIDGATWTWVDSLTVAQRGLSLWVNGQPSSGEECAMIRPQDGAWLGRDCATRLVVVCEQR